MKPSDLRSCALVGVLLVLLCAASARAAAPPAVVYDPRRDWVGSQSTFHFIAPIRWVETTSRGEVVYRENDRHSDYIELFDPARKRYLRLYSHGMYLYVPDKEHFKLVGEGGWDSYPRKELNRNRHASVRAQLESEDQRKSFPKLGDNFEVIGPGTVTYNCICWSVGTNNSWVWPRGPGQKVNLTDFDTLYSHYGFKRVAGLDFCRQEGVDKVVLFALKRDGVVDLTHASRQMPDGSWSSKLGSLPLIRHMRPDDVSGPTYGQPYALYIRVNKAKNADRD